MLGSWTKPRDRSPRKQRGVVAFESAARRRSHVTFLTFAETAEATQLPRHLSGTACLLVTQKKKVIQVEAGA
jgi:hypothetical protein